MVRKIIFEFDKSVDSKQIKQDFKICLNEVSEEYVKIKDKKVIHPNISYVFFYFDRKIVVPHTTEINKVFVDKLKKHLAPYKSKLSIIDTENSL